MLYYPTKHVVLLQVLKAYFEELVILEVDLRPVFAANHVVELSDSECISTSISSTHHAAKTRRAPGNYASDLTLASHCL